VLLHVPLVYALQLLELLPRRWRSSSVWWYVSWLPSCSSWCDHLLLLLDGC
jgi:hypothetical protein